MYNFLWKLMHFIEGYNNTWRASNQPLDKHHHQKIANKDCLNFQKHCHLLQQTINLFGFIINPKGPVEYSDTILITIPGQGCQSFSPVVSERIQQLSDELGIRSLCIETRHTKRAINNTNKPAITCNLDDKVGKQSQTSNFDVVIEDMVSSIQYALNYTHSKQCILVGHSLGGLILTKLWQFNQQNKILPIIGLYCSSAPDSFFSGVWDDIKKRSKPYRLFSSIFLKERGICQLLLKTYLRKIGYEINIDPIYLENQPVCFSQVDNDRKVGHFSLHKALQPREDIPLCSLKSISEKISNDHHCHRPNDLIDSEITAMTESQLFAKQARTWISKSIY